MNSLLKIAESLRKSLRSRGLKVAMPRSFGACVELGFEFEGRTFFIYLYPGRFSEAVIAKLTPMICGCERALACPYGLYALSEPESLADHIYSKLDRLRVIGVYVEKEGVSV
ncbi:MAG: hypothetical protein LRS46_01605 [Desulfurococcales archaeon]|nr:hypothetical protein [Desulfurococcales archaeon]